MGGFLDRRFKLTERATDVPTEIRAGVASFLTMSYCLLVNPQIMSLCGIPKSDVVVATAGASAFSSILVGLLGNLPFGMAPGMGLSAYLTFGLVVSGTLTKEQALTASMLAGLIMIGSTLTGLSHLIMRITPHHIKLAIVVGMGLLIALIGMVSVDLVVASGDDSLIALGDMGDWQIWLVMFGLVLIGTLTYHQIEGGILIGIVLLSVIYWYCAEAWPTQLFQLPSLESNITDNINFTTLSAACAAPVLASLFVMLFDVSGVMFGLASLAKINGSDGSVPGGIWGFLGSAVGTVLAAALGCSPIICAVENAAGIKEGGRTGLTAVVTGLLFGASLFLAPLFGSVPTCATAPVLIMVGAMMTNESKNIDWNNMKEALPAFLCIAMMPFTYSIPNGILFGMAFSLIFFITSGEFLEYCPCGGKSHNGAAEDDEEKDAIDLNPQVKGPGRRSSFFDNTALVRNPSLLLSKDEADKADAEVYEFERSPKLSANGARRASEYGEKPRRDLSLRSF
ncbi:unnamed protein product [Phaeothamnion confervicola]